MEKQAIKRIDNETELKELLREVASITIRASPL
jgi:hypothetical protein